MGLAETAQFSSMGVPSEAQAEQIRQALEAVSVSSALDVQIAGDHYKKLAEYQPWEVLARWMTPDELRGYAKGTAIAYLAREQDKGGDIDIEKACHTLQLYKELLPVCKAFHQ